jgi:hypothetical protein
MFNTTSPVKALIWPLYSLSRRWRCSHIRARVIMSTQVQVLIFVFPFQRMAPSHSSEPFDPVPLLATRYPCGAQVVCFEVALSCPLYTCCLFVHPCWHGASSLSSCCLRSSSLLAPFTHPWACICTPCHTSSSPHLSSWIGAGVEPLTAVVAVRSEFCQILL